MDDLWQLQDSVIMVLAVALGAPGYPSHPSGLPCSVRARVAQVSQFFKLPFFVF